MPTMKMVLSDQKKKNNYINFVQIRFNFYMELKTLKAENN